MTLIYTTQKKFRISCAYFIVLSTSNVCRLWKDEHIKLKFSEDISYNTISNFCEKQLIPSGATLIVQKPLFWPKNTNLCWLNVLTMSFPSVLEIVSELMQYYLFYQALFNYTHTKNR